MFDQLTGYSGNIFSIDTVGVLLSLVALEASLSADNALAIATLVQEIENPNHQRLALNWGLVCAFVLRGSLLIAATWVIQFWQFALAGALYLLWMATHYFTRKWVVPEDKLEGDRKPWQQPDSIWQVVPLIALTDLAFSLDSITAAVALSRQTLLILVGVLLGMLALRFLAGLFLNWLAKFIYLQDAAYLVVSIVGLRMLFQVLSPDLPVPDWFIPTAIAGSFAWGFSKQAMPTVDIDS